jgi:acetyltransferase-like isoleucine patch superfamily enzyme
MSNKKQKLSLTFRFLRSIGLNYPEEEYGNVNPFRVIKQCFVNSYHCLLLQLLNFWPLEPLNPRLLRPFYLRRLGCEIGRKCFIGYDVYVDMNHADLIHIADNVHIDNRCFLLCHKRDLSEYCRNDDYSKLGYKYGSIIIEKGCSIGSCTILMPGVRIGEGAIVGAGSLVTRDIPAWSIAVGRPAKVVKNIPQRSQL